MQQDKGKYKGITYRVMRSSVNTINVVVVWFGGNTYHFRTKQSAKSFINSVVA